MYTENKRSDKKLELSHSTKLNSNIIEPEKNYFYIMDIFQGSVQKAKLKLSHLKRENLLNTILTVTETSTPVSRSYDVFDIGDIEEGNTLLRDYVPQPKVEDTETIKRLNETLDRANKRRESRDEKPPISDPTQYIEQIIKLYFKEIR